MFTKTITMEQAYSLLVRAIDLSAHMASNGAALQAAEDLDLKLLADRRPRETSTYARIEGAKRLRLTWRCYDQSRVFSVRPDRNILTVSYDLDGKLLQSYTRDFED